MRPWSLARTRLWLVLCVAAVAGCNSDSFLPPPRADLKPSNAPPRLTTPASTREIVLILPAEESGDVVSWETVIRQEAGLLRLAYRAVRPGAQDPPSKQAELIRQAASTASALIVVTNRSPETTAALAAIDVKKTPVVLLSRPLPPSAEAEKVKATLVTYPSFVGSARQLVDATVKDAKRLAPSRTSGLEGVIVRSTLRDETSDLRVNGLEEAMKAAGVKLLATETFDGTNAGFIKTLEALKKVHPNFDVLLSEDEVAISSMTNAVREDVLKGDVDVKPAVAPPPPARHRIAGYVTQRTNLNLARFGQVSATADRNALGIAKKAIQVAIDLLDGKPVPDRVEVEIPVVRSRIDPSKTPKL